MSNTPRISATYQIRLLGQLQLQREQHTLSINGRRQKCLFAFLALNPQSHTRESLATLLWPDFEPDRARRNLSDVLYRLRQEVGEEWVWADRDQIGFNADLDVWVDVQALEQWTQSANPEAWERAVALYEGDLLPDLYDDWLLEKRVAYRERYLDALYQLGEFAEKNQKPQKATHYFQRLLQAEPLREDAVRGVMRNLGHQGQIEAALAHFQTLKKRLADELNVPPVAQTQALAERLEKELALNTAVQQQGQIQSLAFVGRTAERARLLARLDHARQGDGGLIAILGDAGIGKSRLLEQLAQAADWRGWQVVWGHSQEFIRPSTYMPLTEALIQALPPPRLHQLAQLVRPHFLALAARLMPHIKDHLDLPDLIQSVGPEAQLPLALQHLLVGLQQIAPHVLILEDCHWADTAVWSLLSRLHSALRDMNLLIVLSGRWHPLKQQPAAWEALQSWDQSGETIIYLQGLSLPELKQMTSTALGASLDDSQVEQLYKASDGNPFLALSLLETHAADPLAAFTSQKVTILDVTQQRIAAVSDAAQLVLQAAAVLGYRFPYQLWQATVDVISPDQLPALAGELEQARLLVLDNDAYRFTHDTLRATVYQNIPAARRLRLHRNALAALRQQAPDDINNLLYHAEQTEQPEAIIQYARQAGEQALAEFSYKAAVTRFQQVLSSLSAKTESGQMMTKADTAVQVTAIKGLIQAYNVLADRENQAQALWQLYQVAQRSQRINWQAESSYLHARFYLATGKLDEALEHLHRGRELTSQLDASQQLQADLTLLLGQIVRQQGKYEDAKAHILQAREQYQALGSQHGEALTTDLLGGLAWRTGDFDEAIAYHAAAARQFQAIDNPFQEAMALNNLGSAYWSAGDYANARESLQQALATSRELRHKRGEADNLDNLGGIAWILADYETAVSYYKQALAIRRQIDDQWGISISLGNLGSAYRLMGDGEAALEHYGQALAVNRAIERRRGEGYNLHGRGLTYLALGQLEQARQDLTAAYRLRQSLKEVDNQLETQAGLALLCLAEENLSQAETHLQQILAQQKPSHRASLRQWTHYAAFRVLMALNEKEQAIHHLNEAEQATQEIADPLPEPDKARFLKRFPLNQEIFQARQSLTQTAQVKLVRQGVPLGRKLTASDYCEITWTLYAPEDERLEKTADRRRHVLQRLLREAAHQGAAPTDSDLAQALGVSRRTVIRDMKTVEQVAATRRR